MNERLQKPGVRIARPVAGPAEGVRNLTVERQVAFLENQKAKALAAIGSSETAIVTSTKAKDGKVVLDSDGFPVLVEKKRLKRDVVAEEFDARIAAHRKACGL